MADAMCRFQLPYVGWMIRMPTSALGGAIDLDPDLVALKPSFSFIVELVHSNFLQGEDATILDQMPIRHSGINIRPIRSRGRHFITNVSPGNLTASI